MTEQREILRRAVVIGGGPAGLMAAEILAGAGWGVSIHDHMPSLGRKFLMAGRGGLNLTHSEPLDRLLTRYGDAHRRLIRAIESFPPGDLIAWAEGLGEATFVGTSGRVFPTSMKASPLLRAWLRRLAGLGVTVETRSRWLGFDRAGGLKMSGPQGPRTLPKPDATILALGGASWPRLGSDGAWAALLDDEDIPIAPLLPANCGFVVDWSDLFRQRFAGEPLKRIAISIESEPLKRIAIGIESEPLKRIAVGVESEPLKRIPVGVESEPLKAHLRSPGPATAMGEAIVTDTGIEGGAIYQIGGQIRAGLAVGPVRVAIDLRPDLTLERLGANFARARKGDTVTNMLRKAGGLSPAAVGLMREAHGRELPTDPFALAGAVKGAPLVIRAAQPIDRAISTAGGVMFGGIDDHYMLTELPGVFVAGEMLDWEAPTGGYLLQASFATAVAAARGAMAWAERTDPAA